MMFNFFKVLEKKSKNHFALLSRLIDGYLKHVEKINLSIKS